MAFSIYQSSVPIFQKTLGNLKDILDKAAAFAAEKKVDQGVLLNYRLAPDMLPLTFQIQAAADHAKRATARLAGVEPPPFEDNEKTIDELKARIDKTLAFVNTVKQAQIDGAETREVTLKLGGVDRKLSGQTYLLHNALPNFFFHAATAHDILRHAGVNIGKRDFLGKID
jgi:uncharacterized protein